MSEEAKITSTEPFWCRGFIEKDRKRAIIVKKNENKSPVKKTTLVILLSLPHEKSKYFIEIILILTKFLKYTRFL